MKKIQLKGKLSLNKETVAKLNDEQMSNVKGGLLSIGEFCSKYQNGCRGEKISRAIFCSTL